MDDKQSKSNCNSNKQEEDGTRHESANSSTAGRFDKKHESAEAHSDFSDSRVAPSDDGASNEPATCEPICDSQEQCSSNPTTIATLKQQANEAKVKCIDEDIPLWPDKDDMTAISALRSAQNGDQEFVQRSIVSLKDYSQVSTGKPDKSNANLAAKHQTTASFISSSSAKLAKSFSQDRTLKAQSKRMSESAPFAKASIGNMDHNSRQQKKRPSPSQSSVSGVGSAVTESRIDKVRKLFVGPLLRTSSKPTTIGALDDNAARSGLAKQQPDVSRNGSSHRRRTSLIPTDFARYSNQINALYKATCNHATNAASKTRHSNAASAKLSRGSQAAKKSRNKLAANTYKVYGCPLQLANSLTPLAAYASDENERQCLIGQQTGQSVPFIISRLCSYIERNSARLTHEGIFRVSGNQKLIEKLKDLFNMVGDAPLEAELVDVATAASLLKLYLRELPEPLIPTRMNYHFIALAKRYSNYLDFEHSSVSLLLPTRGKQQGASSSTTSGSSQAINENSLATMADSTEDVARKTAARDRERQAFVRDLTKLIRKLPQENYNSLKYLSCFLHRIMLKQQYNKMCAAALGIVFGPNIFRIRSESRKGLKEQTLSNRIMACIISHYKQVFDSELTDPLGNTIVDDDLLPALDFHTPSTSTATASSDCVGGRELVSAVSQDKSVGFCLNNATATASSKIVAACSNQEKDGPEEEARQKLMRESLEPKEAKFVAKADLNADDDDEEDLDADLDDDDAQNSYLASSTSASYCSSSSLYSTSKNDCDEEDFSSNNARRHNNRHDDDDDDDACELTDSTSYTPTSSASSHSSSASSSCDTSSSDDANNNNIHDEGDDFSPLEARRSSAAGQAFGDAKFAATCRACRRFSADVELMAELQSEDKKLEATVNASHQPAVECQVDAAKAGHFECGVKRRVSSRHRRSKSTHHKTSNERTAAKRHNRCLRKFRSNEKVTDKQRVNCSSEFDLQCLHGVSVEFCSVKSRNFSAPDLRKLVAAASEEGINCNEHAKPTPTASPEADLNSAKRVNDICSIDETSVMCGGNKQSARKQCASGDDDGKHFRGALGAGVKGSPRCAFGKDLLSRDANNEEELNYSVSALSLSEQAPQVACVGGCPPVASPSQAQAARTGPDASCPKDADDDAACLAPISAQIAALEKLLATFVELKPFIVSSERLLAEQESELVLCLADYQTAAEFARRLQHSVASESYSEPQFAACKAASDARLAKVQQFDARLQSVERRICDLKSLRNHHCRFHAKSAIGGVDADGSCSAALSSTAVAITRSPNEQQANCCSFGALCPIEFVVKIERQLSWKRELHLRAKLTLCKMSAAQLYEEKLELKKNLLCYKQCLGEPTSRVEKAAVRHLHERYRILKSVLRASGGDKSSNNSCAG